MINMAKKSRAVITVMHRRKREGKTNYNKRLSMLKGSKLRLIIRRSNKNIVAQIVEYSPSGDRILMSCHSNELKKLGWKYSRNNTTACYFVGLMLGAKAKAKGIHELIVDLGLQAPTKGSKLFAAAKGAIDAGIRIPCSKEVIPSDDRIKGTHISEYAKKLKANKQAYEKQFSGYIKNNLNPEDLPKAFEQFRAKIKV